MLLNFIVIVQEPWKASVSEVNQITPRDGTEPRALDVNSLPIRVVASKSEYRGERERGYTPLRLSSRKSQVRLSPSTLN